MTEKNAIADKSNVPSLPWKLLIAGLVASMVMAMWEMIVEAILPGGAGFWAAPVMIAATVLRDLQNVATPVPFTLIGVVVGMMGHMMNSVILGIIFAFWVAPKVPSLVGQIIAGMIFGVMIFVVMWYAILPVIDPVMLRLNAVVFLIAHVMWGGALGWINRTTNTAD